MIYLIKILAKGFSYWLHHLSRPWRMRLAQTLGFFLCHVVRLRRRVAFENIQRAFPEWSLQKQQEVLNQTYFYMALGLLEYASLLFVDRAWIQKNARIEGLEHYQKALTKDKGVLLLSLHLGNGDLACGLLSLSGVELNLISKQFKVKWLNELWFGMRARLGTRFIPPSGSSYQILAALRKKESVIFVLDQFMGPPFGVLTNFFGHPTGTALGLSIFHQKTKAPLLLVYTFHEPDGTLVVRFTEEVPLVEKSDREQTQAFMTQIYNDKLEEIVREFPEQWMWIHRRWKEFKV